MEEGRVRGKRRGERERDRDRKSGRRRIPATAIEENTRRPKLRAALFEQYWI